MYNSLEKFYELVSFNREDNRWDYKRDIHLNPNPLFYELLKDILAFGNSDGGWLVLGVNDTGEITGVEKKIDITSLAQKIQTTLGIQLLLELNYFSIQEGQNTFEVGLLYIYQFNRILTSSKNFSNGDGKQIINEDVIYTRRNSSSTKANGDDFSKLAYRITRKGMYEYKKADFDILERNKRFYQELTQINEFLLGKYKFSAISFSHKLNYLWLLNQLKYSKLEIGLLLGLEPDKIDDYFDGKILPKLEHILRAIEIFDLPHDYFFQPTMEQVMPFVNNSMITYCLLDKVLENKILVFKLGMGKLIKEVFYEVTEEFIIFKKWLNSPRRNIKFDNDFPLRTMNEEKIVKRYQEPLNGLNNEKYEILQKHLRTQYYKELELIGPTERNEIESENLLDSLINSPSDRICKFLNEVIKEINIDNQLHIKIQYHFLYEIENQLLRTRTYDRDNMQVNFKETISLKELD